MKNYIQKGDLINYVVPTNSPAGLGIASGAIVEIGSLVGVAQTSGAEGETITVALEGVFELPKVAGDISQGLKLYSNGAGSVTTAADNGGSPPTAYNSIGFAFAAAQSGDATVAVKIG